MTIGLERRGILFVISAPSGGGKSTILRALLASDDTLEYSVSVTSRPPRPGEVHGQSYFFVTQDEFQRMVKGHQFYEWAWVHNYLYGTRKDLIAEKLDKGKDVLLDIDVQGALNVKRQSSDSVIIFLLPPSFEELEKRLRERKLDSEETIQVRLANARKEIKYTGKYDYVIVNDLLEETIETARAIIRAERARASRLTIAIEDSTIKQAKNENS
jgi:guanylate kinase